MELLLPLLIPFGLGVLTWWLTERVRLDIAHRHAIIEDHTKKLHEYVEHYYLRHTIWLVALAESLKNVADSLDQPQGPSQDDLEMSLYTWARLAKSEEEWHRKISSILLLTDQTGEKLISKLNVDKERDFLQVGSLTRPDEAEIRHQMESYEPLTTFLNKTRHGPLQAIALRYSRALRDPAQAQNLRSLATHLGCQAEIFNFEINMCYTPWYGGKKPHSPALNREQLDLVREILSHLVTDREISADDKETYLCRIGTE